jgi:hypothetical protein
MDSRILDALRNAPSLDLYQVSLTAHQLLADPQRILEIRKQLHLGAKVMFFHHRTHELAAGTVVEFRQKEVAIQEDATRTQWWLPYPAIVPDASQRAPEPISPAPVIHRTNFQVGDTVGFTDKYLREHVGVIIRLNDKTVTVDCDGHRWRASRNLLRKVIDL